ncbi:MAG: hypothetical protein GY804_08740 [Alphaproteobacteria bacterium]|nr:hypothetical protein [Alphaproteobacteria bacterium]
MAYLLEINGKKERIYRRPVDATTGNIMEYICENPCGADGTHIYTEYICGRCGKDICYNCSDKDPKTLKIIHEEDAYYKPEDFPIIACTCGPVNVLSIDNGLVTIPMIPVVSFMDIIAKTDWEEFGGKYVDTGCTLIPIGNDKVEFTHEGKTYVTFKDSDRIIRLP